MAALIVTTDILIDGREYSQLPHGVFRYTGTMLFQTGTEANEAQFNFDMNPGSADDFQRYVSIDACAVSTGAIAITIPGALLRMNTNNYEDYASDIQTAIEGFELFNFGSTLRFGGGIQAGPYYLGRILKGTPGRVTVVVQELLNTLYNVTISGLISDQAFLAPTNLKA